MQEGLGRGLAHDLRSAGQAPALGANGSHDVFQTVRARHLLRHQKFDQRRQGQRVRALVGGERRARHGSGQRIGHQHPAKGIGRAGALALVAGHGQVRRRIRIHEIGVVSGVVEAGEGRAAHPPDQHLRNHAPIGRVGGGDVGAGCGDRGPVRGPGKAHARCRAACRSDHEGKDCSMNGSRATEHNPLV